MSKAEKLSRSDMAKLRKAPSRRIHGTLFFLTVSQLPARGGPASGGKFTCVVSKKVSPKAVERNLIKRRCREAARAHIKEMQKTAALVFTAKREARGATFADMKRDIDALFTRAAKRDTSRPFRGEETPA